MKLVTLLGLALPVAWADMQQVKQAIEDALGDDGKRMTSGAFASMFTKSYGCYCHIGDTTGLGNGEPVDLVDSYCKELNQKRYCAALENPGCDATTAAYSKGGLHSLGSTHYETCASANSDACAIKACAMNGRYEAQIVNWFRNINGMSFKVNESYFHDKFDWETNCPKRSASEQKLVTDYGTTCCGSYNDDTKKLCPVNGAFSVWGGYGKCSVSCGDGTKTRTRACDSPPPLFGGLGCNDTTTDSAVCNNGACPEPEAPKNDPAIDVKCTNDNMIDVTINYVRKADIISLSYGTCNLTDISNVNQDSDFNFNFQLDVDRCNSNSNLRSLGYSHNASVVIGRGALTLATYEIKAQCSYTDSYVVNFDYGTLSYASEIFNTSGGNVDLKFEVKSYSSNYSKEETSPKFAGKMIYLGLKVTNDNFQYADTIKAAEGMLFAPKACTLIDTQTNATFTLFDTDSSCEHDVIDLTVDWREQDKMWTISHILFLLGNERQSSYSLSCQILVCDKRGDSTGCDKVVNKCLD